MKPPKWSATLCLCVCMSEASRIERHIFCFLNGQTEPFRADWLNLLLYTVFFYILHARVVEHAAESCQRTPTTGIVIAVASNYDRTLCSRRIIAQEQISWARRAQPSHHIHNYPNNSKNHLCICHTPQHPTWNYHTSLFVNNIFFFFLGCHETCTHVTISINGLDFLHTSSILTYTYTNVVSYCPRLCIHQYTFAANPVCTNNSFFPPFLKKKKK